MGVESFIAIFLVFSVSTYMLMQTKLTDFILGFCLLSSGVNLIFLLLSEENDPLAVLPLTQTLLVSAIVIRFALIALVVVVAARLCANLAGKERSR